MPSPPETACVECGRPVYKRKYEAMAREVTASIIERTAVQLLDAADEVARQTGMAVPLVRDAMLDVLSDDALTVYLRHPEELPSRT